MTDFPVTPSVGRIRVTGVAPTVTVSGNWALQFSAAPRGASGSGHAKQIAGESRGSSPHGKCQQLSITLRFTAEPLPKQLVRVFHRVEAA